MYGSTDRSMPAPVSDTAMTRSCGWCRRLVVTTPPPRELHRIGQQIPEHLLDAVGINDYAGALRRNIAFQPHAFRVRAGPDDVTSFDSILAFRSMTSAARP